MRLLTDCLSVVKQWREGIRAQRGHMIPAPIDRVRHQLRKIEATSEGQPITILDLGFGQGHHWNGDVPWAQLTVVDASDVWLQETVTHQAPAEIVVGKLPALLRDFPDDSFSVVLAFDLIEHLPKHDGFILLYEMQRVARDFAFVYTPNGFVWQPGSPDNPYNAHLSGWTRSDFRKMGWSRLRGHVGPKFLWGPYMTWEGPNIRGALRVNTWMLKGLCLTPRLCFALSAEWHSSRSVTSHQPH